MAVVCLIGLWLCVWTRDLNALYAYCRMELKLKAIVFFAFKFMLLQVNWHLIY